MTDIRKEDLAGFKSRPGSSIAVIGGGPSGSLFSYSLLSMAKNAGVELFLDIYEARDFSLVSSLGCNMCGGVISEKLVKALLSEGIKLPPSVVKGRIASYVLHMEEGRVSVTVPFYDKRIVTVHRGGGPKDMEEKKWKSFDGFLLEQAQSKGANLIKERVLDVKWNGKRPEVIRAGKGGITYDLLVVATGVNSSAPKMFDKLIKDYKPPVIMKAYIRDFFLGREKIEKYLGDSIHVFFPDITDFKIAALIPKDSYVTFCILADKINMDTIKFFLKTSLIKECLPPDFCMPEKACRCTPFMNIKGAEHPCSDRIVFIGDCGVTRLYKDGIGSAYLTARAAAKTVFLNGISSEDFNKNYLPLCNRIERDNDKGRLIFSMSHIIRKISFIRRSVFYMASGEQNSSRSKRISLILWDLFTGSASYGDILSRCFHPFFLGRFLGTIILEFFRDIFFRKA